MHRPYKHIDNVIRYTLALLFFVTICLAAMSVFSGCRTCGGQKVNISINGRPSGVVEINIHTGNATQDAQSKKEFPINAKAKLK